MNRALGGRERDRKERTRRRGEQGAWMRPRSRRLEQEDAVRSSPSGWLAVLAMRLLARLPLAAAHAVGSIGGSLLARLPTPQRHVTRVNLAIAFPELSRHEREAHLRASLAHLGRSITELGALWTWDRARLLDLVRSVEGEEHLRSSLALGRGVILATPHLGSWEVLNAWVSCHHPFLVLYRRPRRVEVDRFALAGRSRFGARLLPAGRRAVGELLRELEAGGFLGMLPDQDSGDGAGVFVPFFGELANTGVLLPRLLARTGAALILGSAERLAGGRGFHVRLTPASAATRSTDVAIAAAALNADIERMIRARPEQYLWSYRRYRIRPPGSEDPYKSG